MGNNDVEKKYITVVKGIVENDEGTINEPKIHSVLVSSSILILQKNLIYLIKLPLELILLHLYTI